VPIAGLHSLLALGLGGGVLPFRAPPRLVREDLDWCQRILGDASMIGQDGLLWSRAELLTQYCDGYRALLTLSQAVRRWVVVDVPEGGDGQFALPRDHERIVAMYYDHRRLQVVEVRELDYADSSWPTLSGYPLAWTTGLGVTLTFEVYQIPSAAGDTYAYAGTAPYGLARRFSGHRTYQGTPAPGLGIPRVISSPDRQYLATQGTLGVPRHYASSGGNLLILEVVGPGVEDLHEEDTAVLIPQPIMKYLKYFVLARAWERQGEGRQPGLSAICQQRFDRGVEVMKHLGWLSRKDSNFQRIPVDGSRGRRQPVAQYPPSYPRTWR
jgi:hypothetical protein